MSKTSGKKQTNEESTFFLTFIGEAVRIAGNFKLDEEKVTITLSGFILDIDDEFYYVGDTPDEITCAIKRDAVVFIEILTVQNQYQEILDELEVPDEDEKKN